MGIILDGGFLGVRRGCWMVRGVGMGGRGGEEGSGGFRRRWKRWVGFEFLELRLGKAGVQEVGGGQRREG